MRPEGKRLAFYSLYAWGVAASVTGMAIVVHFFIEDHTANAGVSPHSFFTWYRIGKQKEVMELKLEMSNGRLLQQAGWDWRFSAQRAFSYSSSTFTSTSALETI